MKSKDNLKAKHQLWRILSILLFFLVLVLFYQNHKLTSNNGNRILSNNQGTVPDISFRGPTITSTKSKKDIKASNKNVEKPGDEILFSQAKVLTDEYLNWKGKLSTIPDNKIEKSTYFYRQDIESIFEKLENASCDSMNQAIRIYFGKHNDTLTLNGTNVVHPYAGRLTMILRAACLDEDLDYSYDSTGFLVVNPSIDFGEICPPNCAPTAYDVRPNDTLRKNGVNGVPFTSSGDFLEIN